MITRFLAVGWIISLLVFVTGCPKNTTQGESVDQGTEKKSEPVDKLPVVSMIANRVIGQADMSHPFPNRVDGSGLFIPEAVAVDTSTTPYSLWIADSGNHRILCYRNPEKTASQMQPVCVLGQVDSLSANRNETSDAFLLEPRHLAVDGLGNVYVSDTGKDRVVCFHQPLKTDTEIDQVIDLRQKQTTDNVDASSDSLKPLLVPAGIGISKDANQLWVSDPGNNRVVSLLKDIEGSLHVAGILGQSATANDADPSAGSLSAPDGVAHNEEFFAVADRGNNRVLLYSLPPADGASAVAVLGQDGLFTTSKAGCSPYGLNSPSSVLLTEQGTILISDTGNNRILEFQPPGTAQAQPTGLLGQENLHQCEQSHAVDASSLWSPQGLALAPGGTLWVTDRWHHRVLGFKDGFRGDRDADFVLGQVDFNHATPNRVDGKGLCFPRDVAVDRSSTPNRLYICDRNNSRILGYRDASKADRNSSPDLVIGQPDLFTSKPGTSSTSLRFPGAVAVDQEGGLYVADSENHRILYFEKPFETDVVADIVMGQQDFDSSDPNPGGVSASTFHRPGSLCIDQQGTLHVADIRNHRILAFDNPMGTDFVADYVWGHQGSFNDERENDGRKPDADTLSYPMGIAVHSSGWLAVSDTGNHRVVLINRNDAFANTVRVLGQGGDFTKNIDNNGGCSARSLSGPEELLFAGDDLILSDTANSRVLVYHNVFQDKDAADHVLGQQGRFDSGGKPLQETTAETIWSPSGMDLDTHGNLYLADREHSRVLVFETSYR